MARRSPWLSAASVDLNGNQDANGRDSDQEPRSRGAVTTGKRCAVRTRRPHLATGLEIVCIDADQEEIEHRQGATSWLRRFLPDFPGHFGLRRANDNVS